MHSIWFVNGHQKAVELRDTAVVEQQQQQFRFGSLQTFKPEPGVILGEAVTDVLRKYAPAEVAIRDSCTLQQAAVAVLRKLQSTLDPSAVELQLGVLLEPLVQTAASRRPGMSLRFHAIDVGFSVDSLRVAFFSLSCFTLTKRK